MSIGHKGNSIGHKGSSIGHKERSIGHKGKYILQIYVVSHSAMAFFHKWGVQTALQTHSL